MCLLRYYTTIICVNSVVTIGLSDGLLQLSEKLSELSDCRTRGRQWKTVRERCAMKSLSDQLSDYCRILSDTVGYCRILSEYCWILSDIPVGLSDRGSDLTYAPLYDPLQGFADMSYK